MIASLNKFVCVYFIKIDVTAVANNQAGIEYINIKKKKYLSSFLLVYE